MSGRLQIFSGVKPDLGVFAYVPAPTVTTTAPANTYVPIAGPFTNPVIEQFTLGVDKIIYSGSCSMWVEISYSGTFTSDTNTTTFTVGVRNGGIVFPGSESTFKLKLTGDSGSVGGHTVVWMAPGDTVQLIVKSTQNGAELTAESFTTTLSRFF